ncbi:GGDEF/response regulator receiver domain protein [Aquitalea magnusonii]|uniref:diguanylate cyclase n=1 Tax=Aquitalea magnusonii TaxID=332411 RepID=A0A3G9GHS1_9NEIS|nr:GGDEF/response regulator receiver domain protein [Aquitalea magnusonii]
MLPLATPDALLRPAIMTPWQLWHMISRRERCILFGGWLFSLLLSLGLGVLSVADNWSGMPLQFGGVTVYITVYPALLISLWWSLCLGWWWGAVQGYLTTLALALYAGMVWQWAALFAFADPLGVAVMVLGFRALPMLRGLRSMDSVLHFVQLSFVGSIFSSSGALIWTYCNNQPFSELLPIWQGWWLGFFLQNLFLVGPVLSQSWPATDRWLSRHLALQPAGEAESRHLIVLLLVLVSVGALVYGYLSLSLGSSLLLGQLQHGLPPQIHHAAMVMTQTGWVFFWVFALLVLFNAFFAYRLFLHWQGRNQQLLDALQQSNAHLAQLVRLDGLTGLLNRRSGDEVLQQEWLRSQRSGQQAVLIMLDIDHFKQVNDEYGHDVGDQVIVQVAMLLQEHLRLHDTAIRYGGEEFLLVLPDSTLENATLLAETLRQQMAARLVHASQADIMVTLSLGVASASLLMADKAAWLKQADMALYQAKRAGRNRVVVAG